MNTIHVSSTRGSDDSGLGTSSAPFRSIGKALSIFSHGNRMIVAPGEYIEAAPLSVRSLDQARIVSPEKGGAIVRVRDGVSAPSVLSLIACSRCAVDGLTFRNHPGGLADGGAVRVLGGNGNLLTNVSAQWAATGLAPSSVLSIVEIANSRDCRIVHAQVSDTEITGSGIVVPIRITDSDIELEDVSVTAATRGSAVLRGILLEATQAVTHRLSRVRVVDLETWNAAGTPPDCVGVRVDVAGLGQISLIGRDLVVARPRALGLISGALSVTKAAGIRAACQESVDISGLVLYRCSVGFDGVNVPNPSRLDRITAHQCGTALRSIAPAPPSRYVVRNVSFSECDVCLEAVGLPGETFFDVDFANFHQSTHWIVAADPVASSFELGAHLTEYQPMYVNAEALDFSLANVSGLINRGGDF